MKLIIKQIVFILSLLILASCAVTKLNGVIDPSYRNVKLKKIVVMGLGMSLAEKQKLEKTFKKSLSQYNVQVLGGLDIAPPTRNYSDKQVYNTAKNMGVDAILTVNVHDRNVSETPIVSVDTSGSFKSIHSVIQRRTVTEPGMRVDISLKSAKNGENIWIAEGGSWGDEFTSFSHLIVDVAQTTAKKLCQEGLIAIN
ncbi:hypothetical protein V3565_04305 [Bartonella sp. B10]